ncbi:MAG: NAAT family transporter [Spirochaetes bacterium]|nr:NAAT family transporter [Spirochaetota bacterium]MBU0954746.1 NAAT family transporter [Spirochaetota bacterium]
MSSIFWQSTLILVLVTDPLGNIPMFISTLDRVVPARRWKIILRETAIATLLLLLVMLGGRSAFGLLGVDDASLRTAGGVILLLIAINMIFPGAGAKIGAGSDKGEPLIVPLAVPLIAGPSAIATVMLIVANHPGQLLLHMGSLGVAMALTMLSLFLSTALKKLVGENVIAAMERLMGLVLTAVSIDMILSGVAAFLKTV